jgi:ABC-type Co2+ transport system permease subunit
VEEINITNRVNPESAAVYVPVRMMQVSPAVTGGSAHFCGLRQAVLVVNPSLLSMPEVET